MPFTVFSRTGNNQTHLHNGVGPARSPATHPAAQLGRRNTRSCRAGSPQRETWGCWPGRTRTGAARFRKPALCPLSYRPIWRPLPESNRPVPFCRRIPHHSGTRPSCSRPDSNGQPRGSEPRALSTAPRKLGVRRDGFEPPCPRWSLVYSQVQSAALPPTHAWGALPDSNRLTLGSQPSPSATWVKAPVLSGGVEPPASWVWTRRSPIELAERARVLPEGLEPPLPAP